MCPVTCRLQSQRQRGALVNIASINGNYASSYMADYVAAKHGVNGISKNFALGEREHLSTQHMRAIG